MEAVERELEQLETADIARKSWETYGEVVVVSDLDEAVNLVNEYAPEQYVVKRCSDTNIMGLAYRSHCRRIECIEMERTTLQKWRVYYPFPLCK